MNTNRVTNMSIWLSLALGLATIGWVLLPTDPPAPAQKIFKGSMGESFEHDPRITVVHNPHGGATHADFLFEGRFVGMMDLVAPPPKTLSPNDIREAIIEDTKKLCSTTTVAWKKMKNRHGVEFDCFSATARHEGKAYRFELYTHVEQARTPSVSDTLLRQILGMHKIYFVIPDGEVSLVLPLAHEVIDSFQARSE
jgi:hypothetical protein